VLGDTDKQTGKTNKAKTMLLFSTHYINKIDLKYSASATVTPSTIWRVVFLLSPAFLKLAFLKRFTENDLKLFRKQVLKSISFIEYIHLSS
jgi:hypothetical protein